MGTQLAQAGRAARDATKHADWKTREVDTMLSRSAPGRVGPFV